MVTMMIINVMVMMMVMMMIINMMVMMMMIFLQAESDSSGLLLLSVHRQVHLVTFKTIFDEDH